MLTVYIPEYEDLWFRGKMLSDPETMSYNRAWGGTVPFPEEIRRKWYDRWIVCRGDRRWYGYLKNSDGDFVGEIAYHIDDDGICLANVIVFAPYRGRGYGSRALDMLCDIAKENGVEVLYDDIATGNPALAMFLKHGFTEEYRTDRIIMLKKEL